MTSEDSRGGFLDLEGGTENVSIDREEQRTPFTKTKHAQGSILAPFLRVGKPEEVAFEEVLEYSPSQCFSLLEDYRTFLVDQLQDLADHSKHPDLVPVPVWLRGNGLVGSKVEYAVELEGVVYWMVEEVTKLQKVTSTEGPVYQFVSKALHEDTKPQLPVSDLRNCIFFTKFGNDEKKCHLRWVKRFTLPTVCGFKLRSSFRVVLSGMIQRNIQTFKQMCHKAFSPKLPKPGQRVLIVGAGPSGLHMAHLLVQRGISPGDLTILEKTGRYGGKTVSVKNKSIKQINEPVFTPLEGAALTQCTKECRTCFGAIGTAACTICTTGCSRPAKVVFKETEIEQRTRNEIPNALAHRQEPFTGGKDIWHELGTCYLAPSYYAVRALLRELQDETSRRLDIARKSGNQKDIEKWENTVSVDIAEEVAPDSYTLSSGGKTSMSLEEWVMQNGAENTLLDNFFPCCSKTAVQIATIRAKRKYCELWMRYLGGFYHTMPPRPQREHFEMIDMSFGQFLEENDLNILTPLFTYALTAQGYGIIAEAPTFHAMQWLNPDTLDGYFEWHAYFQLYKDENGNVVKEIPEHLKFLDNPRKGMLVNGFGGLWDRIVDLHDLGRPEEAVEKCIKYNVDIKRITRTDAVRNSVRVEYSQTRPDGQVKQVDETYDYLVVAAPLSDPVVDPTAKLIDMDLTERESKYFLSKSMVAGQFGTTLFKSQPMPYLKNHLEIYLDKVLGPGAGKGDVFAARDSYKAVQPMLSTKGGHMFDPARTLPRELMCYQYVSPSLNFSRKEFNGKFLEFYEETYRDPAEIRDLPRKDRHQRLKQEVVLQEELWSYFYHHEGEGLEKGYAWDLLEVQGLNHTLFVHASTNFESVLDIVNYNHMILDGLTGVLDELEKPKSDVRPEYWQQPHLYLGNKATNWYRRILNVIFTIFWVIFYVVSYPFAELWYLRFYRYELQKAFQTPDLGSPWSYTMEKFINVAPTTRGYVMLKKGQNPGPDDEPSNDYDPFFYDAQHPVGDHIFKILMMPTVGFRQRFPDIPDYNTIKSTYQWSFRDLRIALRHWLRSFDNSFQPILNGAAGAFLEWASYHTPNMYSFWFSWIMAAQFRLLIGFSYRFEDEQGGGLYIPDCKMLKQAVKSHGKEAGQRICLTVCKVFTEEVLRNKGIMADFQPDFYSGTGCSCVVRTVSACMYSSNLKKSRWVI